MKTLSRRGLFAGCGALSVLASVFHPARRASANMVTSPRRLLIFGQLQGAMHDNWVPTGSETSFSLSPMTSALEPWKSRLLVLEGLANKAGLKNLKGDTHGKALSGILTGDSVPERIEPILTAPSESLDQFLGPKIQGPSRLSSIELSTSYSYYNLGNGKNNCLSYPVGGGTMLPPIDMPSAAFDRLFSGVTGGGTSVADLAAAQRLRVLRQSTLDSVARDLTSLTKRLGASDAIKVQGHLDAIRDLEKQLAVTTPAVNCTAPGRPVDPDAKNRGTIPDAAKLQMELIVQGFACDITRMVTFCPTDSGMTSGAPWLGEPQDVHLISHGKYGDWSVTGPKVIKWGYEQLAYMLKRLGETPDGDATLLDHTLVLSLHEFGESATHDFVNLPIVILGDAGGYLRPGRFLKFSGNPHNDVLVTVANAMGAPITKFGDPALCQGPIAALRA